MGISHHCSGGITFVQSGFYVFGLEVLLYSPPRGFGIRIFTDVDLGIIDANYNVGKPLYEMATSAGEPSATIFWDNTRNRVRERLLENGPLVAAHPRIPIARLDSRGVLARKDRTLYAQLGARTERRGDCLSSSCVEGR